MATVKCSICGQNFDSTTSQSLPFCSPRCRQIDLGRWLDEKQTLPVLRIPEEDDEANQGDTPSD